MQNLFLFSKYLFIIIIFIKLYIANCECDLTDLSGIEFPKSFRLNNGKIIIVGTPGIYVYDSTGTTCLDENPIDNQNKITASSDQCFTTFAQFETGEKYVIVMVKQVIYILNSDGVKIFKNKPTLEINSEIGFYSIVPFIDENNNYNFILGILGTGTNCKPILKYFSINFQGESLTPIDSYTFDSDDPSRENIKYDKGISCQLMNHMTYGNVITCFYHNYRNPQEIGSFSFKLENNQISKVPLVNATYNDQSFCMRSIVSQDKKRCLLCYVRNSGDYNERSGYCSIFDIDENRFISFNKYLSKICETTNNHLTLDYFKESREYVFTCSGASDAKINLVRFDENFNPIQIRENVYNSDILVKDNCQVLVCYSISFSSNEYKIIGQFTCNGITNVDFFDVSEDHKPLAIYSDSPENENTDPKTSYQETPNPESTEIHQNSELSSNLQQENQDFSPLTNSNYLDFSEGLTNSQTESQDISTSILYSTNSQYNSDHSTNSQTENHYSSTTPDSTHSHDNSDNASSTSTSTETHLSGNELDSESSIINSFNSCQWYKNNEGTICSQNIPEGYYIFDIENKIIEKCHQSCKTCEKGPGNNNNNNCLSCFENYELNNKNNCVYKYNYYYDKTIEAIIYLLANQLCPEKLPYEVVETKECVETCSNEEFMNNKCKVNYFSENNMDLITNKLRNIVKEINNSTCDVIIDGNNIIYEITTTKANNDHHNISSINFGECETILKEHYTLDYLLVFKMDVKLNDSYMTYVDYEVYSPVDKTKLNLSLCDKTQIEVFVPINLDNYTNNLYNSINQYGFDIFDKNNSFYNDICTPFTSDDGTDMLLSDRQTNYYNESLTLCETSCIYQSYNITNGKAKCQCQVKSEITDIKTISYEKLDVNTFFDIKSFSNIELIKCFKLTFSKYGLQDNYGSIILLFMTSAFISLIIIFNIKKKPSISRIIRLALKVNKIESPPRKSLKMHYSAKIINDPKDSSKHKEHRNQSRQQQSQTIRHLIEPNIQNDQKSQKRKSVKKLTVQIRNIGNINLINNENYILNENKKKKTNVEQNKRHTSRVSKKSLTKKSAGDEISVYPIKQVNYNKITEKGADKNIHKEKYNDLELNNLQYKEAIKIDKRTYIQYYCSLIKIKHIILCIFYSSNDYNLTSIKISLFIFTFSLYFTVSALFFTDKTMHKIYEDKGIFNITLHLPQIFYSTLITTFLNILIKILALSEKSMMGLKKINNKEKALQKSVELYRCLMIKFNLYYFISLFLLIFFWYYISTFCAVYKNTQIILIESTLTSFTITLIYPFALNLLPGMFRIPALKASKKDKEGLYKIGNIIALI